MKLEHFNIYVISDIHFGHANVINFDQRPFKSLEEMDKTIVNNWNNTVNDKSLVYVIGDIGLCKGDYLENIIKQLRGDIVLIRGNHDKHSDAFYRRCGIKAVLQSASIKLGKQLWTMSHYPLLGVYYEDTTGMRGSIVGDNWHAEHRYQNIGIRDIGQDVHLHGHVHVAPKDRKQGPQFNVCAKALEYRPMNIVKIHREMT